MHSSAMKKEANRSGERFWVVGVFNCPLIFHVYLLQKISKPHHVLCYFTKKSLDNSLTHTYNFSIILIMYLFSQTMSRHDFKKLAHQHFFLYLQNHTHQFSVLLYSSIRNFIFTQNHIFEKRKRRYPPCVLGWFPNNK